MLTPGPRRKTGRSRHPRPRPRRSPASAKATDSTPRRETGPLARCAEQLRRYAERIEQEATAPGEQLTADLTNPLARRWPPRWPPCPTGADTDSD
ncbi:hypothetical protein LNP74_07105 [Klebsiella pneumoniae subsp. pneumoniae]|nr:hypothetical protein [Klebsiella pneumoniae subsp. pneumoniae]